MDIAFVLGDDAHYYGAGIKPLVDLSHGLSVIGMSSNVLLRKGRVVVEKEIKAITEDRINLIIYDNLSEEISRLNPEFVMTHDYSMRSLKGYGRYKRVVYAQILYGLNSLNPYTLRKSIKFKAGSYIPWKFLTRSYINTINEFDYIIANSEFTRDLLLNFYNVNSTGVVYPPVGRNLRKFIEPTLVEKKEGILIYLGHFPDYYSRNILKEIEILKGKDISPVRIIVDDSTSLALKGIEIYSGLPSEALAHLYASSSATYVPTINEMFGHVGPESLLFMTPVILDNYHPFLEFFPTDTNVVTISNPKKSILQEFKNLTGSEMDLKKAKDFVMNHYSPVESAKRLVEILR